MKKIVQFLLCCHLLFSITISVIAQSPLERSNHNNPPPPPPPPPLPPLVPFQDCPGVSVAVTRPGFNANLLPHQIYIVTDSTGEMTPSGSPINLQINGFGLNSIDGFLYGMHETFNVANPYFTRVDKNGDYRIVGTILAPPVSQFKVGLVNTSAGTMDDKDNYYFTAAVFNLQNILLPPDIYVGKIKNVSSLSVSNDPLSVQYKKINPGTCADELLPLFLNPLTGAFQDIAYNPADSSIYTFLPGIGPAPAPGKVASFKPGINSPTLNCIDPAVPNPPTMDLSGLFIGRDSLLYILTIDGKYYSANTDDGTVTEIIQTTLPLLAGNLRGDMASCVGKRKPKPFEGCPGLSLAITRPGINATVLPYQVYEIDEPDGSTRAVGSPIDLQINGFGLNNKDGFLYGMHETSNVTDPFFTRVDSTGNYFDIGKIYPPTATGNKVGIINTAAATMDGDDNYYFTAVVVDTTVSFPIPTLYLGKIKDVSDLEEGDSVKISYKKVFIGSCLNEILESTTNPGNGLLQDIAFNPQDGNIYTYIQTRATLPSPGKLGYFDPGSSYPTLNCINVRYPNVATMDLSGMFASGNGKVYILTIDGKLYKGNPENGSIRLVDQTELPLLGNNLRGDMASCVKKKHPNSHHNWWDNDHDYDKPGNLLDDQGNNSMRISPNPVNTGEVTVFVDADETGSAELQLLDMNSNVTIRQKWILVKGANQLKLNTTHLASGVFSAILVYPSGKTSVIKFIKR